MKFCPVTPEICHGQVHGPWKERRRRIRIRIILIKIIINKKRSKNNKSPKLMGPRGANRNYTNKLTRRKELMIYRNW
jgi:hypothetical protein